MNLEFFFRTLIFFEYFLMFVGIILAIVFPEFVGDISDEGPLHAWEIVILISGTIYFINLYSLLRYKDFSRKVYVFLTILFIVSNIFIPDKYLTFTRLEILMDSLAFLVSGGIFTMIYFSEIKKKFVQ